MAVPGAWAVSRPFAVDRDDRVAGLPVLAQHRVMVVRLDEVVVDDVVHSLPVAQADDLERFARGEAEVTFLVDVKKDVGHVVAIVGGRVAVEPAGVGFQHVGG